MIMPIIGPVRSFAYRVCDFAADYKICFQIQKDLCLTFVTSWDVSLYSFTLISRIISMAKSLDSCLTWDLSIILFTSLVAIRYMYKVGRKLLWTFYEPVWTQFLCCWKIFLVHDDTNSSTLPYGSIRNYVNEFCSPPISETAFDLLVIWNTKLMIYFY